jgi:hypothetical protein
MSNCWKCGRELPGQQVECEPFCQFDEFRTQTVRRMEAEAAELRKHLVPLDLTKVKTLEDFAELFSLLFPGLVVDRRSPIYERLKKFTKTPDEK